jgi:acyl dehydratase
MLTLETIDDMKGYVGKDLGHSEWLVVDQDRINKFAEATGDFQWIHVDVERARRELPTKNTIAHGYLTLSLIAGMKVWEIKARKRGVNYGSNKVRFTNMVPAGSRIRLKQKCLAVDEMPGNGYRITCESVVEIEGVERPAIVAETMGITYV